MPSLDIIVHLLESYGYIFLIVVAIFEGPIITIIGAFLATLGYFSLVGVFVAVVAGDLLGDFLYYGIGYLGQSKVLAGVRRRLGLTPERLLLVKERLDNHAGKALFFAKYSQTGIILLPAAGASRMPLGKFFTYNVLATVPKAIVLILIGYFFGYAYNNINSYLEKVSLIIFGVVLLGALYFVANRFFSKKTI